MRLPALAVRRPIGTAILFLAVVVLGLVSMGRIPVDLMPSAEFPRISITTTYEGVAPAEIETLITRPVERGVSTIQGVEKIEASSSEGLSRVQLQFAWGTDLAEAVNDVRSQLDRLRARLPEEAEAPVIYKFDLSAFPIATLTLSGSGDPRRLRYLAEETIARRLERVSGVASVQAQGGRIREIQVRLDPTRLSALGLSVDEVVTVLQQENRNVSAGDLLDQGREVVIRTVGEYENAEEIAGTVVAWRGERPIHVGDLGEVLDTFQEIESELWIDGEPGIRLRVSKQDGANTVTVVDAMREEIRRINDDYRGEVRLSVLSDSSTFIRQSINNVTASAVAGGLLAVLVLFFFLRNVRATLVVATTIPISILATFALMNFFDISLNVVSFGGLALGIGMLVDNAIVLLENIYRKREEGMDAEPAAIEGSDEVASAITASTLTTVAVFAPVLFLAGFAGIFFREMAIVVSFALACSLLVALTLVPTLSARLLGKEILPAGTGLAGRLLRRSEAAFVAVEERYRAILDRALAHPWRTVGIGAASLALSALLAFFVSFELMPETDEGIIDLDVELAVGTPVETTREVMKALEAQALAAVPSHEIAHTQTSAGPETWWRPGGSNQGEVELNLVPQDQRRSIDKMIADLQEAVDDVPGAEIRIRKRSNNFLLRMMRGGGSDRLSVVIRGYDIDTADRLAKEIETLAAGIDGVAFATSEREEPQIERLLRVDRERLAELGLGGADVAETVETYLNGRVATQLRDAGGEYDIRVRLQEEERNHLDQLVTMPIVTPDGRVVPLSAVARIVEAAGPTSIDRENQERILRVNIGTVGRPLGDIVADLQDELRHLPVPEGFQVEIGGEFEEQQKTFAGLLVGLALAIFLVYSVMAIQFESIRDPLVVMGAVPFAFIGVVLALVLTGTTFNMNSFLGCIVLVGIVVNNAIVLVETANLLRRSEGMALGPAIATAATRRLRPILMTTLTTSLAMLPLAIGVGEGSEIQAPLARVVIGGLLVATGVTLVLVPSLYLLAWRRQESAEAELSFGPDTVPAK